MQSMPKKIDEQLKARAVRLVMEHGSEYSSLTVACEAVARQVGVGKESVRRWIASASWLLNSLSLLAVFCRLVAISCCNC